MVDVVAFLSHHGVKGQKWGIRNKKKQKTGASKSPSINIHEISDEDLQKIVKRMNLEQQYRTLSSKTANNKKKAGADFARNIGKNVATTAITTAASYHVAKAMKKAKIMG